MHTVTNIELPIIIPSQSSKTCFQSNFANMKYQDIQNRITSFFNHYPDGWYRNYNAQYYFSDDVSLLFSASKAQMPDIMFFEEMIQDYYVQYLTNNKIQFFTHNNQHYGFYGELNDNYHNFVYINCVQIKNEVLLKIKVRSCFVGKPNDLSNDVKAKNKNKSKITYPITFPWGTEIVSLFSYEKKNHKKAVMLFSSRISKKNHPLNKAILYSSIKKWFSHTYKKVDLTSRGLLSVEDKNLINSIYKKNTYQYLSQYTLSKSINDKNILEHLDDFEIIACQHVDCSFFKIFKGKVNKIDTFVNIYPQTVNFALNNVITKPIILLTKDPSFYNGSNIDPYKLLKRKYPHLQSVIVETKNCLKIMLPIAVRESKINFEIKNNNFKALLNNNNEEHITDIYWRLGLEYYTAVYIHGFYSYVFEVNNGIPLFTKLNEHQIDGFMKNNVKPIVLYEDEIRLETGVQLITTIKNKWISYSNVYELTDTELPVLMYDKNEVYIGQGVNQPLVGCLNHEYFYGVENDYGQKHKLTTVKQINPILQDDVLEAAITQSMKCPWMVNSMPGKGGLEFRSLPSPFAYLRRYQRMQ